MSIHGSMVDLTQGLILAHQASHAKGTDKQVKIEAAKSILNQAKLNLSTREEIQLAKRLEYQLSTLGTDSNRSSRAQKIALMFYRRLPKMAGLESKELAFDVMDQGAKTISKLELALDKAVLEFIGHGNDAHFDSLKKELKALEPWKQLLDDKKLPNPIRKALEPFLAKYQAVEKALASLEESKKAGGTFSSDHVGALSLDNLLEGYREIIFSSSDDPFVRGRMAEGKKLFEQRFAELKIPPDARDILLHMEWRSSETPDDVIREFSKLAKGVDALQTPLDNMLDHKVGKDTLKREVTLLLSRPEYGRSPLRLLDKLTSNEALRAELKADPEEATLLGELLSSRIVEYLSSDKADITRFNQLYSLLKEKGLAGVLGASFFKEVDASLLDAGVNAATFRLELAQDLEKLEQYKAKREGISLDERRIMLNEVKDVQRKLGPFLSKKDTLIQEILTLSISLQGILEREIDLLVGPPLGDLYQNVLGRQMGVHLSDGVEGQIFLEWVENKLPALSDEALSSDVKKGVRNQMSKALSLMGNDGLRFLENHRELKDYILHLDEGASTFLVGAKHYLEIKQALAHEKSIERVGSYDEKKLVESLRPKMLAKVPLPGVLLINEEKVLRSLFDAVAELKTFIKTEGKKEGSAERSLKLALANRLVIRYENLLSLVPPEKPVEGVQTILNDPNILKAQIEAFQLLALDQSFKFLGNLQTEVVRSDNKLAKGFQAASRVFANPSVQGVTTFSSEKQLKNFERDIFFEQSSQNLKVIANSPLFSDLVSLRIAEMDTLEGDERNDALRNLGRLLGVADYADRPPSVPPLSKKESDLVQSGKFQQLGIILIRQFESVEDKDDFISKLPIGNWPDDAKQKLLKNFIPEEPDTSKQIQSYLKEWTALLKVGFTDLDFNQPLEGIVYLRQAPTEVQQAFRTTYQTFIDKENPPKKGMLQEKLDQIFSPPKPAPKEVKVEKKSAKVLSDDEVALKGMNVRLQFQIDRIKDLTGDEKETALKMGMSLFSQVRVLTDRITNSEIAELREGANRIEEDARRLQAHDLIDKMAKKVKDADLFAFALQFHHLEEGKALEFLSTLPMDGWMFGMKMRFLGNVVPSTQMGREAYLNRWTSIINRGFEKRSDDPLEQKIQSTALLNELKKGLEIDFQSVPQEVKKRFASALQKAGWSDLPFKL